MFFGERPCGHTVLQFPEQLLLEPPIPVRVLGSADSAQESETALHLDNSGTLLKTAADLLRPGMGSGLRRVALQPQPILRHLQQVRELRFQISQNSAHMTTTRPLTTTRPPSLTKLPKAPHFEPVL